VLLFEVYFHICAERKQLIKEEIVDPQCLFSIKNFEVKKCLCADLLSDRYYKLQSFRNPSYHASVEMYQNRQLV